jgi:hypothetical protein
MTYYPQEPDDPNMDTIFVFLIVLVCGFCYYGGQLIYAFMMLGNK